MNKSLKDTYLKILKNFTDQNNSKDLIEAKKEFFSLTGEIKETDDFFEYKMSVFNDWFLFDYKMSSGHRPIEVYIESRNEADDLSRDFLEPKYSLYKFEGFSFRKNMILRDLIENKKIHLSKDHYPLVFMKNDFFTGRIIQSHGEFYLLKGVCPMPEEALPAISKEIKKYKKDKSFSDWPSFLYQLELLNTKWHNYSHMSAKKVFVFI